MTKEQILILKTRWQKLCNENYKNMGDSGSCVLGAGLMNGQIMIVKAFEVSPCQGNIVWETGLSKLISEFNEEFNTQVWHEYGNMD